MGDASDRDPVLVLKIGAEGGSLELLGLRLDGGWTYELKVDEVALLDEGAGSTRCEGGLTWEEALAGLDRYPWRRLYTVFVHPEWEERIEVARRTGELIHPDVPPFL